MNIQWRWMRNILICNLVELCIFISYSRRKATDSLTLHATKRFIKTETSMSKGIAWMTRNTMRNTVDDSCHHKTSTWLGSRPLDRKPDPNIQPGQSFHLRNLICYIRVRVLEYISFLNLGLGSFYHAYAARSPVTIKRYE